MILGVMLWILGMLASVGEAPAARPSPWLGGVRWIDSKPLTDSDLAGKVVLVEFWTFECINCRRTVPAMKRLETAYRGTRDVVIIGVHTPELDSERDLGNVRRAVHRLGLGFPVATDNQYVAWNAFHNEYWPALYLMDRRGAVRWTHAGELHEGTPAWDELGRAIARLRGERT
jgi:thiol-disulfide isomerase/thioredoxin